MALQRALNPARGILYRFGGGAIPIGSLHLTYDNSDVAGTMTTDGAKAYLITPYAGYYIATLFVCIASVASIDAFLPRIYDEDSNGEIGRGEWVSTAPTASGEETTVVATSCANLDATRRITTSIASKNGVGSLHAGDDTNWAAKFTLTYLGPHI